MHVTSGSYVGTGAAQTVSLKNRDLTLGKWWLMIKSLTTAQLAVMRFSTNSGDTAKPMVTNLAPFTGGITNHSAAGIDLGTDARVNSVGITYLWYLIEDDGSHDVDVFTYTGTGVDNRNVTNGSLGGNAPDFAIVSSRSSSTATGPQYRFGGVAGDASQGLDGALGANAIQSLIADGIQVGTASSVNLSTGSTVYDVVLLRNVSGVFGQLRYLGDGTDNRNITGLGWSPDHVPFVKAENTNGAVGRHALQVGDSSYAFTASTPAADRVQSILSDGFQSGASTSTNANAVQFNAVFLKDSVAVRTATPVAAVVALVGERTASPVTVAVSATIRSATPTAAVQTTSVRTATPVTAGISSATGTRTATPVTAAVDSILVTPGAMELVPTGRGAAVIIPFSGDSDNNAGQIDYWTLTTSGAALNATSITLTSSEGIPVAYPTGTRIFWFDNANPVIESVLTAPAAKGATSITVASLARPISASAEAIVTDVLAKPTAGSVWDFQAPLHPAHVNIDRWLVTDVLGLVENTGYDVRVVVENPSGTDVVLTGSFTTLNWAITPAASLVATRFLNSLTGNDAWDGTSATFVSGTTGPWRTISKVRVTAPDGAIVDCQGYFLPTQANANYFTHQNITLKSHLPSVADQADSPTLGEGHGKVLPINQGSGQTAILAGLWTMAPAGQPSVDPHGLYQGAGLWKLCDGIGGNPAAIVGPDGNSYSPWVWAGGKTSGKAVDELWYSTTRDGIASRIGAMIQDTQITTGLPNRGSISGGVHVLFTNDTYRGGCFSLSNDTAIYMNWTKPGSPNDYWWDANWNGDPGIVLTGQNMRLTGWQLRAQSYGAMVGSVTLSVVSNTRGTVIDHCWFNGFQYAHYFLGVGVTPTGSLAGRTNTAPRDTLVEHCLYTDRNNKGLHATGYNTAGVFPWSAIKEGVYWGGVLMPGNAGRMFRYCENVAVGGAGVGFFGLTWRHCEVEGVQNGITGPVSTPTLEPMHTGLVDGYELYIHDIGDDPIEFEGNHSFWRFWNSRIADAPKFLSTAPGNWGTITLFNLVESRNGTQGSPLPQFYPTDPRRNFSAEFFKNGSHQSGQGRARLTVVNCTLYSIDDGSASAQAADVADFPSGNPTDSNQYRLFNNVMVGYRYVWHVDTGAPGAQEWDADHSLMVGTGTPLAGDGALLRGITFEGIKSYGSTSPNSATTAGANSVATLRTDLAPGGLMCVTYGRSTRPNRRNARRLNSLRVGGAWVDYAISGRAPADAQFVDLTDLNLLTGSGAVDAGMLVPALMTQQDVDFFGLAPDLGGLQTNTNTSFVRTAPPTAVISGTYERVASPTATITISTTRVATPVTVAVVASLSRTATPVSAAVLASPVRTAPVTAAISSQTVVVVVTPKRHRSLGFPGIRR